jgi:hypothetical protein
MRREGAVNQYEEMKYGKHTREDSCLSKASGGGLTYPIFPLSSSLHEYYVSILKMEKPGSSETSVHT